CLTLYLSMDVTLTIDYSTLSLHAALPIFKTEEEQFARTLEQGLRILEQDLAELKGSEIPGDIVFKLYDTYGFPMDLTGDIARERGLTIDEAGFEAAMEAQRERARAASQFGLDYNQLVKVDADTR